MFYLKQLNVITGVRMERRARGNCPPPLILNPTLGISTDTDNATDTTLKSMSVL